MSSKPRLDTGRELTDEAIEMLGWRSDWFGIVAVPTESGSWAIMLELDGYYASADTAREMAAFYSIELGVPLGFRTGGSDRASAIPPHFLKPKATRPPKKERKPQARRRSISLRRRFAILQRDEFTCQLCGRGAHDGLQLHVDHQQPVARGGVDNDENLWTLCSDCNYGKSDRL